MNLRELMGHFNFTLSAGLALAIVVAGCSSGPKAGPPTGKSLSKTDEQIFLGDTIEKNYDPHVIIKRAEAFFEREEFPESVVELQHFLELHRAHALAPYAEFRLGEAYLMQARTIDRDPEPIHRAVAVFQKLRTDFPGSRYDEQAAAKIRECQEWMAKTHLFVGQFYYRRGAYLAAAHRYEVILNEYGDMQVAPEALYRLAQAYQSLGADDWAREQLALLAQRYPDNPIQKEGQNLLAKLAEPTGSKTVAALAMPSPTSESRSAGTLLAGGLLPPAAPEFSTPSAARSARIPGGSTALTASPTFCRLGVWC